MASAFNMAISNDVADDKVRPFETDELGGPAGGVRAREQQRSTSGFMHGGKT